MSNAPAVEYLRADFSNTMKRYRGAFRFADRDPNWHGPSSVRPMIEVLSIMDAGEPMHVTPCDYHDPDRWWL